MNIQGGWRSTSGSSSLGGVVYKGTWNATTNVPVLGNGGAGGVAGDYYVVNVAGTTSIDGISDWEIGDWIINNGTVWEKVDNTDAVTSVNGFQGAVSLGLADILSVSESTGANNIIVDAGQYIQVGDADKTITSGGGSLILQNLTVGRQVFLLTTNASFGVQDGGGFEYTSNTPVLLSSFDYDTSNDSVNIANAGGFTGSLLFSGITAPRSYTMPDASGTIALTSDIPSAQSLSSVLTVGNTTGGTSQIITNGDSIIFNSGISQYSIEYNVVGASELAIVRPSGGYVFIGEDLTNFTVFADSEVQLASAGIGVFKFNNTNTSDNGNLTHELLTSGQTWTLPDATGTIALESTVQNLENTDLTSDSATRIYKLNGSSSSETLQFQKNNGTNLLYLGGSGIVYMGVNNSASPYVMVQESGSTRLRIQKDNSNYIDMPSSTSTQHRWNSTSDIYVTYSAGKSFRFIESGVAQVWMTKGGVQLRDSSYNFAGTNYIALQDGTAPLNGTGNSHTYYSVSGRPEFKTGTGATIKLYGATALTASDGTLANAVTRIGEIETNLQAQGLLL